MIAATQVLTIMYLIKRNLVWKGSLALLFIGGVARLFYKFDKYKEKNLYFGGHCVRGDRCGAIYMVWNYWIRGA